VDDYVEALREGLQSLRSWVGFWGPVIEVPAALRPAAILGTVIGVAAVTGLALASLALFVASMLLLYLILTQIFGVEVSIGG
jgi:hypothetical protein